ncbi:MBL fold metallo-hydrolase [Bacillaceae bacterium]
MLKVTVLGCHSPYPGPGGATAGYLVETDGSKVLLDCGSGVLSQLQRRCGIEEISAVILSHLHNDHIADIAVLQYAVHVALVRGWRKDPLALYTPLEPRNIFERLPYRNAFRILPVEATAEYRIGEIDFSFLQTDHPIPCYAMKLRCRGGTVVYGADSGPGTHWNGFADGADLLLCEATYLEKDKPERPTGHLSAQEAAKVGERMRCKRLVLTHYFPGYARKDMYREARPHFSGKLTVAKTGLELEV